ncbi:hypothetical protein B9Z55_017900 [Caenorhabditis nigoni]|nr:hypothetical protein B9Z55_017900 [Caenorhabditis nigoni]
MDKHWVFQYLPKLFCGFAYIVNPIFIYLIFSGKSAVLGNYRYLLLYFACFNLFYSVANVVVPLDIHSYRYCFFLMLSDGHFVEISDYHSHILIARCSLILSSYAVLMSHFIYRYLAINNSSLTKKRFPLFMIGSFIMLAAVFATWHFLCWTIGRANTEIREYIRQDFREVYGKDSMNFNMLAALYQEGSKETVTQSWIVTFFWSLICTAPIIGFMILGRMIIVELRKTTKTRMSQKMSQFQVDLLRALAVRTIIPICISFLPAVLCWYTPMFGIQLGRFVGKQASETYDKKFQNIQLLRKKQAIFGNYRFLLLFFTTYNLTYSIANVIVSFDIHSYRYCFFLITRNGWFVQHSEFNFHIICACCSLVIASYAILLIHFIYRYLAIHNSDLTRHKFHFYMSFSIFICALYFGVWYAICYFLGRANREIREYIREGFRETYGKDSMDVSMLGSLFSEGSDETVFKSWLAVVLWLTIITVSTIMYVVLTITILMHLKKMTRNTSKKTSKFQVDLLRALVVQTVIPIFISFSPCLFFWVGPMFGIQLPRSLNYLEAAALGVFPFVDPMAIIMSLPVFRKRIFSFFRNPTTT